METPNTDDISTVCYSILDDTDSAYNPETYESFDLATEDGSSHGTIEDFCMGFKCVVCDVVPNSATAQVLDSNWALEGQSCQTINGTVYYICTECRPIRLFHSACLPEAERVAADTEYVCMDCRERALQVSNISDIAVLLHCSSRFAILH